MFGVMVADRLDRESLFRSRPSPVDQQKRAGRSQTRMPGTSSSLRLSPRYTSLPPQYYSRPPIVVAQPSNTARNAKNRNLVKNRFEHCRSGLEKAMYFSTATAVISLRDQSVADAQDAPTTKKRELRRAECMFSGTSRVADRA